MNEEGIRSVLNWINGILNPQVVQGNFPTDSGNKSHSSAYEDFIYWFRRNLGKEIITKRPDWELADTDTEGIIDFIMSMVEPFMTRLIGNQERISYGETIKHIERQELINVEDTPIEKRIKARKISPNSLELESIRISR